jgi:hypothetical protein
VGVGELKVFAALRVPWVTHQAQTFVEERRERHQGLRVVHLGAKLKVMKGKLQVLNNTCIRAQYRVSHGHDTNSGSYP